MMLGFVLVQMKLLSPAGLYRLVSSIWQYGISLLALLRLSERSFGDKTAVVDDRESISFKQLFADSTRLSGLLQKSYGLKGGMKVGLLCKNHGAMVRSLFAVSSTGADIYLLNADMSPEQLSQLFEQTELQLLIYDEELGAMLERSSYSNARLPAYHDEHPAIGNFLLASEDEDSGAAKRTSDFNGQTSGSVSRTRDSGGQTSGSVGRTRNSGGQARRAAGQIILLTGGTTGKAKQIAHKPSLFHYLHPFSAMLARLQLLKRQTVFIATPLYHGYGLAILLLFVALGKKAVLTAGFDAAKACRLVREHRAEVATVVPLMVDRMLRHNADDMRSLACIASGGAELNPRLAEEVGRVLGPVLYNLYGTSQTGLNIIATPQHLQYSGATIGKRIRGVRLRILTDGMKPRQAKAGQVGRLCVKTPCSVRQLRGGEWVETGDLGYCDRNGYYFLCGRTDDMIVSGGENVYPIEIEQTLLKHPLIDDAAVLGIKDEQFGQRLRVFIQPAKGATLTEAAVMEWLRGKVARYQMPKEIIFVDRMPYTSLGKKDKKRLRG